VLYGGIDYRHRVSKESEVYYCYGVKKVMKYSVLFGIICGLFIASSAPPLFADGDETLIQSKEQSAHRRRSADVKNDGLVSCIHFPRLFASRFDASFPRPPEIACRVIVQRRAEAATAPIIAAPIPDPSLASSSFILFARSPKTQRSISVILS